MSRRKESDDPKLPEFITSAELCEVTGYTDVHHREAAKKGYFPPPKNGLYQAKATLKGIMKRERELREKSTGSLAEKRQREIMILDIEIGEKCKSLVPIDEVLARLNQATAAARQCISGSTLSDEEKERLQLDIQEIYRSAGKRNTDSRALDQAG